MITTSSWSLVSDPSAAAAARDVLRQRFSSLPATVLEDVLLLVTELVANAVRHGGGPVTLRLSSTDHYLRIEVTDASPTPPQPLPGSLEAESGRGLLIVDVLASRWGTTRAVGPGKAVWFELDLPHGSERSSPVGGPDE